jgi:pimeloyl-ACP methyl ester carboxylesterase
MIAALNGVVGDHLSASANLLAERMQLRQGGRPLDLAALDQPSGKILLMVHGLCLNDRHWRRHGHDHGVYLSADLGYTPIYLRYNTGLHISANGRALDDLLEELLREWPVPVEELAIVGHSMGGLVARSACHYGKAAGHAWPQRLRRLVFLGTPHHGAPLERHGNALQSLLGACHYTAAYARLGQVRSAGITDLRYGSLLDEDWAERARFAHAHDSRRPVPLPEGVQCYAIAASTARADGGLRGMLLGDGLVPHASALGDHPNPGMKLGFPAERQWVGYDMHHLDLLDRRDVYERLRQWLSAG